MNIRSKTGHESPIDLLFKREGENDDFEDFLVIVAFLFRQRVELQS